MKTSLTFKHWFCSQKLFALVFMVVVIVSAGSCGKEENGDPSDPDGNNGTVPKSDIVGYEYNGSKYIAQYWKDGVATPLSDGTKNAEALSVSVSGEDVFVAGYENEVSGSLYDDPTKMPKYWKNGISVPLNVFDFGVGVSNGTNGAAMSVFGRNGNAYIVGYMSDGGLNNSIAAIWINGGTPTLLTSQYNGSSEANSVFVTESGDIYVVGEKSFMAGNGEHALLWVNGSEIPLTDGSTTSRAYSVYVSGSDVYVCGGWFNSAKTTWEAVYWKNGAMTHLTDGSTFAMAYSIYANGNDVHVVGDKSLSASAMSDAAYWKNGTFTSLSKGTGSAKSVYVSGSDVYVCGYKYANSTYVATCWKNGNTYLLTDGTEKSFATGIFIR
jgi:hypothetical protein